MNNNDYNDHLQGFLWTQIFCANGRQTVFNLDYLPISQLIEVVRDGVLLNTPEDWVTVGRSLVISPAPARNANITVRYQFEYIKDNQGQ